MDILRRVADDLTPAGLAQTVLLTSNESSALEQWKMATITNDWVQWKAEQDPEAKLWTDASEKVWAYLIEQEGEILEWKNGTYADFGILIGETIALSQGLHAVKAQGFAKVAAMVDNQALVATFSKGLSRNNLVNSILANSPTEVATVTWVPTHLQAADPLTRGGNLADAKARLSAAAVGFSE